MRNTANRIGNLSLRSLQNDYKDLEINPSIDTPVEKSQLETVIEHTFELEKFTCDDQSIELKPTNEIEVESAFYPASQIIDNQPPKLQRKPYQLGA